MTGFIIGYLNAQVDNIDNQIKGSRDKITDIVINNK
jgi:hypothetical protein